MKHTLGPWTVDPAEQHATSGNRIFKVCSAKPYGGLIADVSAWWVDVETAEVNARLIAAAPDLLEELTLLLKYVENLGNREGYWPENEQIRDCHRAIDKATS